MCTALYWHVERIVEGDCLTGHRRPLARPLGMPSGHVAHASLRGDAWIHYYLVMDFTDNNNQTILIDRSVIWVHGTYHVIKSPHHPSDLHLLVHPLQYLHHHPAIKLSQAMWNENVLTHRGCYLLGTLGIWHGIQCGSLIMMVLRCWSLACSLTWSWSQRRMNWIMNFVNDTMETETGSDYVGPENMMRMGYW